ncbi:hypothetical protein [Haloarcula nitratireducens]|uniref:Uncharacterized protein n=1 Tax=Haloarcula nitratireducens TaxID=2487749 RepID=A0AAW4P970_9EURY|nr:hypothetical protein [Halomicroarcula nitratireducens]MBX0294482.1 hypothetical protein [Halomicroarcula nitratireducens]
MSAVSLLDVYRYGTRFVGYFLVVSVVGGAFVGIGMVLGASSATSPTVETNRALLGVAVAGIGVLLTLSGLFGLAHKLVADATRVGAAAAVAATDGESVAERVADEPSDESATTEGTARADSQETTDERQPAGAATAATGAAVGGATAATDDAEAPPQRSETQPPAADPDDPVGVNRPGQRRGGSSSAASTESEPAETTREPAQSPSAAAGTEDGTTADRESVTDRQTATDVGVPGAEPTDDAPSSEATATGTDDAAVDPTGEPDDGSIFGGPTADAPSDAAGEPTAREANGENEPTSAESEAPQEWSPPDPTEFEQRESQAKTTETDDDETAGDAPDFADWGTEGQTDPDVGTDTRGGRGEPTDGPRTTDDLFGEESSDESDPFERPTAEETRVEDDSAATDATAADATDEAVADQPNDEDDPETAGSTRRFEVDSDSDPLSDALDDE